ncbi:unnamed protein product [Parascedosporium putredinis]|uniref:Uncharacterized protein n=1 Tax=Parascedosporium putredinis TaxID=1442378 RepID=A0A9P1MBW1_9PEZI|nr:unnamed protein product [Parascedosporium putredinis]CAI8000344.1 unnamed protein product [Parascedosporium putredinis]
MPLEVRSNEISLAERQATGNRQATRQESARERLGSLEQATAGSAVLGKRASAKRARQLLTRLLRGHVNGLWEFDDARLTMSELRAIAQLDPEEGSRRARLLVLRPDVSEMTGILIWRRIVNRLAIPETIMAILDQAESRRSFTKVQESAMPSQDLRRQANAIIRREAWVGDYRVSETSRVAECRPRKGRIVVLMSTVEEESCEAVSSG